MADITWLKCDIITSLLTNSISILDRHFILMSRIERKYCLVSTSYLAGLFDIFILLHICVCFGDFLQ